MNITNTFKKFPPSDWIAIIVIFIFSYRYIELGFLNYKYFETGMDLGGYTQAFFNLSHFRLPFNTFKNMVMWGDHAHFIIALFAPLYRIFPDARLILIIQALAVTLAGWPIYKISRLLVKNMLFSLAILYAYLAFIGIQFALNFDFHPNVLTGAAIAWFFYGFHFKNKYIFWTSLILGLMTREDAPPIFFLIGFYFLLFALFKPIFIFLQTKFKYFYNDKVLHVSDKSIQENNVIQSIQHCFFTKQVLTAFFVMVISFSYFCLVAYVVMPFWTTDHVALTYLDSDQKDPYNVIRGFFQYPKAILENMTDTARKRATMETLFSSFGYLSLLSPMTYITSISIFYSRFASSDSYRWIINNHENANILPILAIGAIYGATSIKRILNRIILTFFHRNHNFLRILSVNTTLTLLAFLLVYSVQKNAWSDKDAPLYFSHEEHVMKDGLIPAHKSAIQKVNEIIPKNDMISVSGGFTAHLGNRQKIQNYPDINNQTKWLVLSIDAYSWPFSKGSMRHEIKVTMNDHEFEKVWSEKEVYIFKRTIDRTNEPEKTTSKSSSDENGD